jgi:hypothetical protein
MIRAVAIWLVIWLVIMGLELLTPFTSEAGIFRTGASSAAAYVGPGDITSFTHWYGPRCFDAAKATGTTNIAHVIRAVGSPSSTDIVCLTNGSEDVATLSAFCSGTSCTEYYYDQAGTNNMSQAISGFPAVIFNCVNITYPCFQMTSSSQSMKSATTATLTTGIASEYIVADRVSYTSGAVDWFAPNGSGGLGITAEAVANKWYLSNNGVLFGNTAATDGAWHIGVGISNGSSSVLAIDGAETTGTSGASTATNNEIVNGAPGGGSTADELEFGYIDNVVWTNGSSGSIACQLAHNAGTFYGITVGGPC